MAWKSKGWEWNDEDKGNGNKVQILKFDLRYGMVHQQAAGGPWKWGMAGNKRYFFVVMKWQTCWDDVVIWKRFASCIYIYSSTHLHSANIVCCSSAQGKMKTWTRIPLHTIVLKGLVLYVLTVLLFLYGYWHPGLYRHVCIVSLAARGSRINEPSRCELH